MAYDLLSIRVQTYAIYESTHAHPYTRAPMHARMHGTHTRTHTHIQRERERERDTHTHTHTPVLHPTIGTYGLR